MGYCRALLVYVGDGRMSQTEIAVSSADAVVFIPMLVTLFYVVSAFVLNDLIEISHMLI